MPRLNPEDQLGCNEDERDGEEADKQQDDPRRTPLRLYERQKDANNNDETHQSIQPLSVGHIRCREDFIPREQQPRFHEEAVHGSGLFWTWSFPAAAAYGSLG